MTTTYYLGITDYVVIALSLLVSAAIGIFFRYSGGRQKTMKEYLMAGKNMSKLPVIFSITVTMTSASTMLSSPAEVYRYGTQYVMMSVGLGLGMLLSSFVFVPVYFQCGVTTTYEYLEMRFGKLTRYTISAAFILQMVLYMSVVLYAAVLALSAVTNLSFEMSVIFVGICCAFYCSLGGLKAVLWTDVFQAFLMLSCVVTVCVAGIGDAGGISKLFSISKAGQRLQLFNFSLDLITRYTFWNSLLRGVWAGVGYYGTGQTEVQRMLSLSTSERAKSVLRLSVLPVMCFHLLCDFTGLIMYGIYHACDPILNKHVTGLTKYDQIIPYYIVTRVGSIPGLTGLCIAGIFSGSLSTVSSALNSLATVTIVDFLKPIFPVYFNEKKSLLVAKCLSAFYGIVCVCFALGLSGAHSVKQMVSTLLALMEGPMVAIFTIAVLTRKANDRCIVFGFSIGMIVMCWFSFGALFSGYIEPSLPIRTSHCFANISTFDKTSFDLQGNLSMTTGQVQKDFSDLLIIYKISFNWLSVIGTLMTVSATFLAVIFTGGWRKNVIPADSKCLSPVRRLWTREAEKFSENKGNCHCQLQQLSRNAADSEDNVVDKENM